MGALPGLQGQVPHPPRQIGPVHRVFRPAEEEVIYARRVVEDFEEAVARGHGAVQVDGRMVDPPVAKRARGFDMRVLYYDPFVAADDPFAAEIGAQAVDLDTLLGESDFVSLHTLLNEETHHLIDADAFAKMKPAAILVNTSRGPVVDPDALHTALVDGQISYAALDVTEPEPIPADSPLLGLDNVIVVPHIGSASVATRGKMAQMAAENLIAGLKGERLPNCANPEVYG